jgi:hypothetical protein
MKHIVLFSGGCGSAYTAYLISKQYNKKDIILLHTSTFAEHPDTKRFMNEISKFLKIPITYFNDGRSLWELIDEYKAIPNQQLPFCTLQLKQRQTKKYCNKLKKEKIDFILYFGYGIEEYRRMQLQFVKFKKIGIKVGYPLIENKIKSQDIKKIIINNWKICLPITYKILKHNNCLPCFKGGKNHFYKIWKYFIDYYMKAENAEKQIGYTVFKDTTLEKLRKSFENQLEFDFDDKIDSRDCLCVL